MADQTPFFAHSAGTDGQWEPLTQHLTWVADLAAANGRVFGADEECRFAGVLHDLGKYGARFQGRLHGTEKHIDHWSAGAFEAALSGKKGFAAALAIQGHHIGLQRGDQDSLARLNVASLLNSHPLGCTLSDDDHRWQASVLTGKVNAEFRRRANAGKCFAQPSFGLREFPAFFELAGETPPAVAAIPWDADLGWMLYDVFDLSRQGASHDAPSVSIFRARVTSGLMEVPPFSSPEVRKVEAVSP